MTRQHNLPNLLDDHICRKDIAALVEALGQVRKHAFDARMSRCKTRRLQKAVARTIDDAMVLGLLVEYLQRSPVTGPKQRYADLAAQQCISAMARAAQPHETPSWASFSTLLTGKLRIPHHVRMRIFSDLLPALFDGYGKQLPITIFGDLHQSAQDCGFIIWLRSAQQISEGYSIVCLQRVQEERICWELGSDSRRAPHLYV